MKNWTDKNKRQEVEIRVLEELVDCDFRPQPYTLQQHPRNPSPTPIPLIGEIAEIDWSTSNDDRGVEPSIAVSIQMSAVKKIEWKTPVPHLIQPMRAMPWDAPLNDPRRRKYISPPIALLEQPQEPLPVIISCETHNARKNKNKLIELPPQTPDYICSLDPALMSPELIPNNTIPDYANFYDSLESLPISPTVSIPPPTPNYVNSFDPEMTPSANVLPKTPDYVKPYFDPVLMLSTLVPPPTIDNVSHSERMDAASVHVKLQVKYNELQDKSRYNNLRNSNEVYNVNRIRDKFIDLFGYDSDCDNL